MKFQKGERCEWRDPGAPQEIWVPCVIEKVACGRFFELPDGRHVFPGHYLITIKDDSIYMQSKPANLRKRHPPQEPAEQEFTEALIRQLSGKVEA